MRILLLAFLFGLLPFNQTELSAQIFDVHVHGIADASSQIRSFQKAGVYKAAISSSWDLQNTYRTISNPKFLFGLMFPCPNGKVPYSLQPCYGNGEEWPSVSWVEEQIKAGKIDYLGEVLGQYYGITPSDSLMIPYYRLAQQYHLPVGIHTGGAGPNHGSPNFKWELGNPALLKPLLTQFPDLKVWIMHSGDQYYQETIAIMKAYPLVYADISVISDTDIVPAESFSEIMRAFIQAGLENRLMFGTDNGDIEKIVQAVEKLDFLSTEQKRKLYFRNAEDFFSNTALSYKSIDRM